MKKLIIIASTLVLVSVITSCKKDRTCVCTTTVAGIETVTNTVIEGKTKKDAKTECEASSGSTIGVTNSCELKK